MKTEVASDKLKARMLDYLKEHSTMTIATVRDGMPWAASVFYANDGFTLYFLSDPTSRHSKDLADNPLVAVTVSEDYHEWRQIKGIQLEGTASLVSSEDEMEKATRAYAAKYPFTTMYLKLLSTPFPKVAKFLDGFLRRLPAVPSFGTTLSHHFYKVVPRMVRFTDNEQGFGHHEEFTL